MKKESGITLMSLVLTIIVMLIIAGISFKIMFGSSNRSNLNQFKDKIDATENQVNQQDRIANDMTRYQEDEWGL